MYYSSFLWLVVLPIVLVVAGVSVLFGQRLIADANETVDTMHTSVASTLRTEVEEASLGLAYYVLGNDQAVSGKLEKLPQGRKERYDLGQYFKSIFDYIAFQDKHIEALHLYLSDGTYFDLVAGLAVPVEDAQAEACYQRALAEPNRVTVGGVSPNLLRYTTNHPGDVLLCAALSPREARKSSALSVACLYFSTSSEELLKQYNESVPAGRTFLMDGETVLAGDQTAAHAAGLCMSSQGKNLGGYDWYTLTKIPHTNLSILTLVNNHHLLANYYRTMTATLGIISSSPC